MIKQFFLDAGCLMALVISFCVSMQIILFGLPTKSGLVHPLAELFITWTRRWVSWLVTLGIVAVTFGVTVAVYGYRLFKFIQDKYRNR